jgi:hypothetical protein
MILNLAMPSSFLKSNYHPVTMCYISGEAKLSMDSYNTASIFRGGWMVYYITGRVGGGGMLDSSRSTQRDVLGGTFLSKQKQKQRF